MPADTADGPVAARVVHRVLRATWNQYLRSRGYSMAGRTARWHRRLDDGTLLILVAQVSRTSDRFSGSQFWVLLGDGETAIDRTNRLGWFLDDKEREAVRELHNEILTGLPEPSADYLAEYEEMARSWKSPDPASAYFLTYRQNREQPYRRGEHLDLVFFSERDVGRWGNLIAGFLPGAIDQLEGRYYS